MGDGVIDGGWNFVIAAYAVVWGGIGFYTVSLLMRLKRAELNANPEILAKPTEDEPTL